MKINENVLKIMEMNQKSMDVYKKLISINENIRKIQDGGCLTSREICIRPQAKETPKQFHDSGSLTYTQQRKSRK